MYFISAVWRPIIWMRRSASRGCLSRAIPTIGPGTQKHACPGPVLSLANAGDILWSRVCRYPIIMTYHHPHTGLFSTIRCGIFQYSSSILFYYLQYDMHFPYDWTQFLNFGQVTGRMTSIWPSSCDRELSIAIHPIASNRQQHFTLLEVFILVLFCLALRDCWILLIFFSQIPKCEV